MFVSDQNYSLFLKLINAYAPLGFNGINPDDPLLLELEESMKRNNQFFFAGDIINIKILYVSKRSIDILGILPEDLNLYHFFEATHPDDLQRHNLARSKLFGLAQGLFIARSGEAYLSTNLRIRNPYEGYSQILFQCYMFYTTVPYNTVLYFQVHTNIDWFRKIRHGFHYYKGPDQSYFRYPDEKLLLMGNVFSDREFEIIKLIKSGLNSEHIAEKLFLSVHTVNTHRTNILDKTGKTTIWEVIYELIDQGLLQ